MENIDISALFIRCFSGLMKAERPRRYGSFTKGEMCILAYLADKNSPALPGELAAVSDVSTARIATVLRQLEAKGQIQRAVDPNDRRCVLVSLTDAGRRIVLARRYELNEYFSHVLDRLGERDAREGLRILQRIAAIVEEMENGETMAKGNAENDPK